jgi:eukaryotic-like serine/threonine-protein kinase
MALKHGDRLGPYDVLDLIGEGGMGQVYKAHDTTLNRDVALKVLPETFISDPDRLARFRREAQALAALNHPHIAHIYGVEESNGVPALVMEFVDGPTLEDLIGHGHPEAASVGERLRDSDSAARRESPQPAAPGVGPRRREGSGAPRGLKIDDALPIARQIADALEAAHEQGIIHRDLKPANVKVKPDGTVKLLDFGLAKAVQGDGSGSRGHEAMNSPTLTARATELGTIIGTAAYMAPEQARGRAVDRRADIWAFGVVLYEMLAGRRAFKGEDVSDTLAAVLRDTPDFDALPAATPPPVRRLLERCLTRDVRARLRDIGEARIALETTASADDDAGAPPKAPVAARTRLIWMAASFAAGAALVAGAWAVLGAGREAPAAPGRADFAITLPDGVSLVDEAGRIAVSPDGRQVVFAASKDDTQMLWMRPLDGTEVTSLPGTKGARQPFWSPDGAFLGFFAGGKLQKLEVATGAVQVIADGMVNPAGATWNRDGTIVVCPVMEGALFRVSAAGGTPAPLTTLDQGNVESNHLWPSFLPDGRHYLFQVFGLKDSGIYAGQLGSDARTRVMAQTSLDLTSVAYASGRLVFVRDHALVAQPFDPDRLALIGDAVRLASGFGIGGPGRTRFGVSQNGVLVYQPEGEPPMRQLVWVSRGGARLGPLGAPAPLFHTFAISPDGRTIAVSHDTEPETSIWLIDVARGTETRFTSGSYSADPVWGPKGGQLGFVSVRDTPPNPFVRTLGGAEQRLARVGEEVVLTSWAPDGKLVIGAMRNVTTGEDLFLFPTSGDKPPEPFLQTPFNEFDAQISPDGRVVAFTSNESGTNEVYLTSFPSAGRHLRVSASGGTTPRWRGDGRELYLQAGADIMAASVTPAPAGGFPDIGGPHTLFTLPADTDTWAVAPDGQRFLVATLVHPAVPAPVHVVVNWLGR